MDYVPDPEIVHELLRLVAAERECCGWAVTSSARRTRLDVVAAGAGAQVLWDMFGVDR